MNERIDNNESNGDTATRATEQTQDQITRRRYEAPKMMKKRSVAKVTLFSGGGASAGGLTAAG